MKDTIKNSIIGAFAIFGFVTLISSSNNAKTVVQDTKQVWSIVSVIDSPETAYKINRETGEVWYYHGKNYYKTVDETEE
jgi:hypothetical protein